MRPVMIECSVCTTNKCSLRLALKPGHVATCTLYPEEVEQEGQVVWILMVVSPIMQEQCLNCGLGCLGRNNVLPLA